MDDDNPRPPQRPRVEGPQNDRDILARAQLEAEARRVEALNRRAALAQVPAIGPEPLNAERDRAVGQIIREISGQTKGAPTGEARYDNSHDRGGGGEFRSFHSEANAHLASREPDGENTRRLGPNGGDATVQTSGQSSREGLDHPGQPGRAPASMAHADMGRSSLEIRRRDERGRNPMEMD